MCAMVAVVDTVVHLFTFVYMEIHSGNKYEYNNNITCRKYTLKNHYLQDSHYKQILAKNRKCKYYEKYEINRRFLVC